jgi:chromosome segregation ATPase
MTDKSERVERARGRRQALRSAMMALEAASAAPVAKNGWLEDLAEALARLTTTFDEHVEMVEGENGLLEEIKEIAPQLKSEMDQMHTEHREIHTLLDSIKTSVKDASATPDASGATRHQVRNLLSSLAEHRQRGADLVYDAYNVDISVGD